MIQKDAFKHKLLRNLKADGGPFDSVEDIDNYMRTERSEKEIQKATEDGSAVLQSYIISSFAK